MARSSTTWCQPSATWQPRGASSAGRCAPARSRLALRTAEQYADNPIEVGHGRLKARLRPMRGLKRHLSASILAAGHVFVQNLRRGHYDIAAEVPDHHRLRIAFDDLAPTT